MVGLFDVCGKVGEIPQSSLTPAVPQGGSAHGPRSVSTELQATHREVTSLCSRYSYCRCWPIGGVLPGILPVIAASGRTEQSLSPSFPTGPPPAPADFGQQSAGEDLERGSQTLSWPVCVGSGFACSAQVYHFALCPLSMSTSGSRLEQKNQGLPEGHTCLLG